MPRELEIRTTILAKKPGHRSKSKDSNYNDVYVDEALQLLDELQKLKANIKKTDQRIVTKFRKCVPQSASTRAPNTLDLPAKIIELKSLPKIRHYVANSIFTPAPPVVEIPSTKWSEEFITRPASRPRTAETATTETAGRRTGSNVAFKRVYAAASNSLSDAADHSTCSSSSSSSLSSSASRKSRHSHRSASDHGRSRGEEIVIDSQPDLRQNRPSSNIETAASQEEKVIALDTLVLTETVIIDDRTVTEEEAAPAEEVRTSPPVVTWDIPVSSEAVLPADVSENVHPVGESRPVAASNQADDRRAVQAPKARHYDRREIRTYMAKQKRERKEKHTVDVHATHVCNHSRPADKHRMEGLPEAARVKKVQRTKSRDRASDAPPALDWTRAQPTQRTEEENWGPSANFARTFLVPPELIPPPRAVPIREKSIQTDTQVEQAPSVISKVDEAIQVSPLPSNANESTASTWLHVHPSRLATAPEASIENFLVGSASVSISSSTLSSHVQVGRRPSDPPAVVPDDHLIRQIEHLENYIGHLLDAPPFRTYVPPFHPVALPADNSTSFQHIPPVEQPEDTPDRPPHDSVSRQKHDWTVSTQYHQLPDRLNQFLKLKKPSPNTSGNQAEQDIRQADYKYQHFFRQPEHPKASKPKTEVTSIFNMNRNPDLPSPWTEKAAGIGSEEPQTYFRDFNEILQMDCKTNPLTESSLSWKRIDLSRSTRNRSAVKPDVAPPQPPPYNILTAISGRLAKGIQQIPLQNTTSDSDFRSGISMSDASVADQSDAATVQPKADPKNGSGTRIVNVGADAGDSSINLSGFNSSANSVGSSRKRIPSPSARHPVIAVQSPTPAKKSEAGTSQSLDLHPPQLRADLSRLEISGLNETTYRTLTPQYTSFDSTREIADEAPTETANFDETSFRPIFPMNLKLSPIPRLDSSIAHRVVSSDSEPSLSISSSGGSVKRKQSTSSERDRSVGENPVVVVSRNESKTKPVTNESADSSKPAELLARLRSELNREESLRNSLHHLSNLERSTASGGVQQATQSGKVHVKLDAQTRSFLERQTASIRAMVEDLGSGFQRQLAAQSAFVKGSQAAMAVDRIKSRSSRTETQMVDADDANTSATTSLAPTVKTDSELHSFQTYSSDFEDASQDRSQVRSTAASSVPSESNAPQAKQNKDKPFQFNFEAKNASRATKEDRSRRRKPPPRAAAAADTSQPTDAEQSMVSESKSELDPLDVSNDGDSSILAPKAVDLLVLEEAKQQRLLLKLREKATVERTLAELELLQMQKRILRAQGEREKAASIKKKQRGLLLKLQDERAKIEAMRKVHRRQVDRRMEQMANQAANQSTAYESSSWETDWSAPSADSNRLSADAMHADKDHSSNTLMATAESDKDSSGSAQPVSEAIQDRSMDDKDPSSCDNDKRQADVSAKAASVEVEGGAERNTENPSSVPSFRLRSPLSPRADNIRMRMKFRPRHSSGSDDSINLSQTETTSDVSDVESRVLALTDQLQRRQAEAHRLKVEHKRISKEKLKSHESALLKQIEVYDRCISELRTQLDRDPDADGVPTGPAVAMVAVRPLIRQPRAAIRADETKSPTSSSQKSESDARTESEPIRKPGSGVESPPPLPLDSAALLSPPSSSAHRKLEEQFGFGLKSPISSVSTDIRPDSEAKSDATLTPTHERSESEFQPPEFININIQTDIRNLSTSEVSVPIESSVPVAPVEHKISDVTVTIPPKVDFQPSEGDAGTEIEDDASVAESIHSVSRLDMAVSQGSERTTSEVSLDKFMENDADVVVSDIQGSGTDNLNQTMIVKNDSQLEEELAEEISKAILEQLLNETIELATNMLVTKKEASPQVGKPGTSTNNVLERVSAILSASSSGSCGHQPMEHPSQLYMTTTFDIFSSPEDKSPANETSSSAADEYLPAAAHRQFRSDHSAETSPLPCDVTSPEGRIALEYKLNELRDEWMDDDLQATPVTAETALQEAEELERKQQRIEQEIQRLSQYMQREIPNKPPPPYTPPGQSLSWKKAGSSPPAVSAPTVPQIKGVPRTREFITRQSRRFAEFLLERNFVGIDFIVFPEELFDSEGLSTDQPPEAQNSYQAYLTMLSDLTRSTVRDLKDLATFLPGFQRSSIKGGRLIQSRSEFLERVEHVVQVELNMKPRFLKENQLTKWSQKKRDRVDEILIKELQMEEKLWTNFSQEEVQVKHQTADAIWELLMNETVALCKRFALV